MRELNLQEAALVAGGNQTLEDASLGQPNSFMVSYEATIPGLGTVTLTAKCVDYLQGLDSAGSGSQSGI